MKGLETENPCANAEAGGTPHARWIIAHSTVALMLSRANQLTARFRFRPCAIPPWIKLMRACRHADGLPLDRASLDHRQRVRARQCMYRSTDRVD